MPDLRSGLKLLGKTLRKRSARPTYQLRRGPTPLQPPRSSAPLQSPTRHDAPQEKNSVTKTEDGGFRVTVGESSSPRATSSLADGHESKRKSSLTSLLGSPTLGPNGTLPLSEQLRWMTLQWSLHLLDSATVTRALQLQLKLLEDGTMFRAVLDEMIEEQQPHLDSPEGG